jgi:transcriptional regulator with XRE-family HTH domain
MVDNFYKKLGEKIKNLREQVGLSQADLADQLGVNRVVVSQIESGQRKISAEETVHLAKFFNTTSDILLNLEKDIIVNLDKKSEQRMEPEAGIRINVPQKNMNKFKQVLLYILNKVGSKPNVGESVLYKLLYFIDFDYYEKYEEQLIGATYIKNNYGPTPKEFIKIIGEMEGKEISRVESQYFQYPQTKYLPLRSLDLSELKANELKMIDSVLGKLSDMNATEISEYSHKDVPWLTTEEGKIIEYESVFYRTPAYSARSYDEEDIQ